MTFTPGPLGRRFPGWGGGVGLVYRLGGAPGVGLNSNRGATWADPVCDGLPRRPHLRQVRAVSADPVALSLGGLGGSRAHAMGLRLRRTLLFGIPTPAGLPDGCPRVQCTGGGCRVGWLGGLWGWSRDVGRSQPRVADGTAGVDGKPGLRPLCFSCNARCCACHDAATPKHFGSSRP